MSYAKNTSAPVIKLNEYSYYCVEAGVWFKASTPQGPWTSLDTVPDEIYTIPPSSPIYYVTYVKVYNSTPEVVYVGLHAGLLRHSGFRQHEHGRLRHRMVLRAVYKSRQCGMAGRTPTVWEPDFTWADDPRVGASASATATPTTPGITRGGDRWVITVTAGIPITDGARGAEPAVANVYGMWGNTAYSRTAAAWANPYTGNYGAASRGSYYNTQTGRSTVAGRGYNTNIYTGNTAGYRGAATYNPNTGIVAGGGAGYAGNIYSGQGTAGRGGFAYNTNTNAGVAAGKNNVYAGKDGTVYRYNRQSGRLVIEQRQWLAVDDEARCQSATPTADAQPGRATHAELQPDARQLRRRGWAAVAACVAVADVADNWTHHVRVRG